MFAKITKGDRMAGLLVYLQGEGRYNEHTNPHVVAGDPAMMAWHSGGPEGGELSRDGALSVAHHLDRPYRAFAAQEERGAVAVKTAPHVWQCSIALRAWEGELSDEDWREIAEKFVERMGFGSTDMHGEDAAPTRWAAVRHGLSEKGNDHIHLVVNLVREDGTRAPVDNDFPRARDLCRELETEFGLAPLYPNEYDLAKAHARAAWESARREELATSGAEPRFPWAELTTELQDLEVAKEFVDDTTWRRASETRDVHPAEGTRTKAYKYGEREAVGRRRARAQWDEAHAEGREKRSWEHLTGAERARLSAEATPVEQPRETLSRMLRACSTASADEAEFVRRVRRSGVLVRPRFDKGTTDVVTGYSVALRPAAGERPIWYGGGRLADDLALPRLRAEWPDTPEQATAAAAEWTAVSKRQRPVAPGRETHAPTETEWDQITRRVEQVREQLRVVPVEDRETWARVARQASGAFAAWSAATEGNQPGPIAATADALARSAQTVRPEQSRVALPSIAGTAFAMMAAGKGNAVAVAALVRQLSNLAQALHDMHKASGAARRAQVIEQTVRGELAAVGSRLAAAQPSEQLAERREPGQRPEQGRRSAPPRRDPKAPSSAKQKTGPRKPLPGPDRGIDS